MYCYVIFFFTFFERNQTTVVIFSVYGNFLNTLLNMIWIYHINIIHSITETARKLEITEVFRNTWIDGQTFVGWLHTQDCLR